MEIRYIGTEMETRTFRLSIYSKIIQYLLIQGYQVYFDIKYALRYMV